MAYGFRPIANDVKLANLGQIYAQNQQAQMQMDNNALQQQSTLATLAKAQQETESARAANELISSPDFDFSNPQTRKQLLLQKPDLYKALNDELKNNREISQKTVKDLPEIAATFAQLPEEQKPAYLKQIATAYPDAFTGESANIEDPRIVGGFSLLGEAYLKNKTAQKGKGQKFSMTSPDGTVIEFGDVGDGQGGANNAKPTVNLLQKGIVESAQNNSNLLNVEKLWKPEFNLIPTQIGNDVNAYIERLGGTISPEKSQKLAEYQEWKSSVQQAFNDYRIAVTGASAPLAELGLLEKTFLSTKQSPTQFKAAMSQLKQKYSKAINLQQQLLSQGIPIGSPQYGKLMDSLWLQDTSSSKGRQQIQSPAGDIDAMAAQVQRQEAATGLAGGVVEVPDENAAMSQPIGTRFRLPDGRTGTVQ